MATASILLGLVLDRCNALCLLLGQLLAHCLVLDRCGALCLVLGRCGALCCVVTHRFIVVGLVRLHVHRVFGLFFQVIEISRSEFALILCFSQLAHQSSVV